MPLYEFECKTHGRFDRITPVVVSEKQPCPTCKKLSPQVPARPAPFQWGKGGKWN